MEQQGDAIEVLEENGPKNQDVPEKKHLQLLLSKFGYKEFRPLQWTIISSLMNLRQDNCAIMATGYGKSLCFQYPPVFMGGLSLVISPLISLMEDQVLTLQAKNINACLLGTANKRQGMTTNDILNNEYSLVYLTPEFCTGDYGIDLLLEINKRVSIRLIAIDEAHCVSSWGHDFRPSYQKLGILRDLIPNVPILAITATATPPVQKEIIKVLQLRNPQVLCTGFDRPNLYFAVFPKGSDVFSDIKRFLKLEQGSYKFDGPTIIYTTTKENAETISALLKVRGICCGVYHAGINLTLRKEVQKQFYNNEIDVIVATIAFGMGIDKPNVRNVIHYGCPNSLEGYYQEAGRAGRDGLHSKCTIFYNSQDFVIHRLLRQSLPQKAYMNKVKMMEVLENYLQSSKCRRKLILSYFEGKDVDTPANPNCCDNCAGGKEKSTFFEYEGVNEKGLYDFTDDIKTFLSVFLVLKSNYGMVTFIDFLRGLKRSKYDRHIKNPAYGSGKDKSAEWWKEIGNLCLNHNFLCKQYAKGSNFNYEAITITTTGKEFLDKKDRIFEKPSEKICSFLKSKSGIWINKSAACTSQFQSNVQSTSTLLPGLFKTVPQEDDFDLRMHLLSLLKNKRDEIANEKQCAIYLVASDRALRDLACKKPFTLHQLKQCEDFTNDQVTAYGEEFLKIIYENTPKTTIKDLLIHYPLSTNICLNSSQQASYSLFSQGLSMQEIAEKRNLAEGTIHTHLVKCLKTGIPIKLNQLGVTAAIKNDIVKAIEKIGMVSTLTNLKQCCPEYVSYRHIECVKAYCLLREHLKRLGIPYEEFEDFDYHELKFGNNSDDGDSLTQLIDGLKEVQDINNVVLVDDEKIEVVQHQDKKDIHEGICKSNVKDAPQYEIDRNKTQEYEEHKDLDITDDDLLAACEEVERSFSEPDSKRVKITGNNVLDYRSVNTPTLNSSNKIISSDSTSSDFLEEGTQKDLTQASNLKKEDEDLLLLFDIQDRGNNDKSLDKLSVLDSPPRLSDFKRK